MHGARNRPVVKFEIHQFYFSNKLCKAGKQIFKKSQEQEGECAVILFIELEASVNNWLLGPVSRKSRKLFAPEKLFLKLRPVYSVKLVFSNVVKRTPLKITAKFRASRGLSFEDTKRIMSPEMRPNSGLS